jgi:gluconolactonase
LNGAAVYRIDAPGKVARILAAPDVRSPNGIQISPDDRKLYLVESNQAQGGPRLIRSYDLQPDGTVRNMRVLYDFSPGRSADGMSIDIQGNLYASAGMNQLRGTSETLDNKAGVYVISPRRQVAEVLSHSGRLHYEQRVRRPGHEDAVRYRGQDAVQAAD